MHRVHGELLGLELNHADDNGIFFIPYLLSRKFFMHAGRISGQIYKYIYVCAVLAVATS